MQSQLVPVTINGELKEVPSNQSVAALLECLKIGSQSVAVELNEAIVRKRDWQATTVPAGSRIEIVEFVGGG